MKLFKNDIGLLLSARRSNGGGVDPERFVVAAGKRMLKAGLVEHKKHNGMYTGHIGAVVITRAGRDALIAEGFEK